MKPLKTITRIPFLLMVCMAIACSRPSKDSVEITQAAFGVYRTPQAGRTEFQPTRVVPFAIGQRYGWLIGVKTERPRIRWREELTLPSAPATWGSERVGTRNVAANNRSVVTEREVAAKSGYVFNAWEINPGDPRGHYTIKVTIEGGPPRVFEFELK
jgi:hypothetical protein